MGARGPRKKLAALEKIEGNPGCRPIVETGVEALGEPFVPEHLSDDARGCIEVIIRSMPPRVYAAMDSFLLAAFGKAWAVHKRAAHEIANPEFDYIVMNSAGNLMPNPWIRVLNHQAQIMASLGDRLGLDPKARAQLKLPEPGQKASKFEGLLGHSGSSTSLNA